MIHVEVTDEIIRKAEIKAEEMGRLNNSIRGGEGNIVGFIGEFVVAEYTGGEICNTYDYDVIIRGVKCDVKTKECGSPPKDYYDCSVAAYNTSQKCDVYIFVRVSGKDAWLLGWESKDYFKKARFLKKGEIDPSNNFTVRADCYNLEISKLRNIEVLRKPI